jgi:SAM-dependent methyltransferase
LNTALHCPVCKQSKEPHDCTVVREMMFGMKESFEYFECSSCGLLWLEEVPHDLQKYYPQTYYSFRVPGTLKSYLKATRGYHYYRGMHPIGFVMSKIFGKPEVINWLEEAKIGLNHKILDVGCGKGSCLRDLSLCGFQKLAGIDPYIDQDVSYQGIEIKKGYPEDLNESFDFIMFNHSLEHMTNPETVLGQVRTKISPLGTLLIRVPVKNKAWEIYRENWVGIDAPRHIYIHTEKSLNALVSDYDFKLTKVVYDSTEFQFMASEQYKENCFLESKDSFLYNKNRYSKAQIQSFHAKARDFNANGLGDSACFYFSPS